jgi:hypothetical protein
MHDHLDNASLDYRGAYRKFPTQEPIMNLQMFEPSVAPGGNRGDQPALLSSSHEGGEGEQGHDLRFQRDWVFEQSGDGQEQADPQAASPADTEALSAYLDEREMEIPQRI